MSLDPRAFWELVFGFLMITFSITCLLQINYNNDLLRHLRNKLMVNLIRIKLPLTNSEALLSSTTVWRSKKIAHMLIILSRRTLTKVLIESVAAAEALLWSHFVAICSG